MPAKRTPLPATVPASKCRTCKGACCRYITMHMPTPGTINEFDGLMWQISHENIQIFKDSDGWHLLIYTPCTHLEKSGKCAIYNERPNVCREHPADVCEYDESIADSASLYFRNAAELDVYCTKRFKGWKKRFKAD